jgi:zinc transporter 9
MALIGNSFLTVVKFVAFAMSGSGAMFSEGLHSLADTTNQGLLFIGIRRSSKPANATFHYGHGGERFLFALLSAVGIFVLGCGVTLYHGVHTLLHPPELTFSWVIWVVLAISLVVDGVVLRKAWQAVREQAGDTPVRTFLGTTSDPTPVAVLLEDGAACLGVLLAAAGIGLSELTGSHVPDALATIAIGVMMGGIAVFIGWQNRSLLLGRALPPEQADEILGWLREQPTIERVGPVRHRVIGAESYRFGAEIDWDGRELGRRQADWLADRLESAGEPVDTAELAAGFGERMTEAVGDEVDRVERELRARHPELHWIDIESE